MQTKFFVVELSVIAMYEYIIEWIDDGNYQDALTEIDNIQNQEPTDSIAILEATVYERLRVAGNLIDHYILGIYRNILLETMACQFSTCPAAFGISLTASRLGRNRMRSGINRQAFWNPFSQMAPVFPALFSNAPFLE